MTTGAQSDAGELKTRVAKLRRALTQATYDYRQAAASRDSEKAIALLKSRSQLMRELLEAQCELLLSFRSEPPGPSEESTPTTASAVPERVLASTLLARSPGVPG